MEYVPVYHPPEGCPDEGIDKAKREYLESGGDPKPPFLVVLFVSPEEVRAKKVRGIDRDGVLHQEPIRTPLNSLRIIMALMIAFVNQPGGKEELEKKNDQ